jgi:ankyrin repeat protein
VTSSSGNDLAEKADAFCEASIRGDMRRAAALLSATPAIATSGFGPAVILGEADRVREFLERDRGLATRPDSRTGWTALHAACTSRWHQLEPERAAGLAEVVRLLLDAGADAAGRMRRWLPLGCVVASANTGPSNRPVAELLLARGAVPGDEDLYLAGFAQDRHELLALLVAHVENLQAVAEHALAAAVGTRDVESARILVDAGADARRYRDDDGEPVPVLWDAVRGRCGRDFLELMLAHGADPNAAGPDGRTAYALAVASGRTELADLLRQGGADDTATAADRFLSACRRADRAEAQRLLEFDPGLVSRLTEDDLSGIVRAAESGDAAAVALMLDLGFPIAAAGDFGGTVLHAAAYAGSAEVVRVLLDRGADIESRDPNWNSPPLDWAAVGSGERPDTNPAADWTGTVRVLLEHGASTAEITLEPDDPKPPSREVAALLRAAIDGSPRA